MKNNYSGLDMRREMELFAEETQKMNMDEKFVKDSDPSLVIAYVMEKIGGAASKIESLFNSNAQNRNAIVGQVRDELRLIVGIANEAMDKLAQAERSPEDTNKTIGQ